MANMDLMALLSTIVLVATIATTIFAVAAYAVSRGYTRRKTHAKVPLGEQPTAAAAPAKKTSARGAPILKRYNPFEA